MRLKVDSYQNTAFRTNKSIDCDGVNINATICALGWNTFKAVMYKAFLLHSDADNNG